MLNDMGVKLHIPSFKGTERTQLTSSETILPSAEGKWTCCIWNVLVLCIALSTWILTLEMFSDLIVSELVSCEIGPVPPKLWDFLYAEVQS
jgi:hypothetical protein